MRLKSLKLSGFKSFANPTTFTFRHGITAIVGPNGCGKSNVIDAIRWVLGESSAKQLRGGAMSDVIFAGTQNKAAKSLASVELTFQHTQDEQTGIRHELNIYHELSVRRQINADGKSDYFINGTRCRRRDVVDVFLGTGLGPRSYSVIQQGMIGRIVDSSPLQLREFIEEAAGVSRYQARREETQKKLLKTRENLDRLNDIQAELTRQKQKLSKQADNATQYQQIKDELSQVKEQLAISQLYQAKAAQMQHKTEQQTLAKILNELQETDAKLKQKLTKMGERLSEEQWLKDEARDKLHEQDMQRQQAEHKMTTLQSSLTQLEGRLQANLDRQQRAKEAIMTAEKENHSQTDVLTQLTPQLASLKSQQQQLQAKYAPLQEAWEASNAEVAKIDADKRELEQRMALDKQARARLQLDLSKWQIKEQAWQQEASKWGLSSAYSLKDNDEAAATGLRDVSVSLATEIADIDAQLKSLEKQKDAINDNIDSEQPILKQLNQTLAQQQQQFAQLEKQHASLMAEYDTLHAIVHPKKPTKPEPLVKDAEQKTESVSHKSASSALGKLAPLHEQIKLTKAGEAHTDVLDKWLAFWLDARVWSEQNIATGNQDASAITDRSHLLAALLADSNESNQQANQKSSKQNKAVSNKAAANSVFFESTDATNSHNVQKSHPNLTPLTELIAAPKLAVWQQAYLYVDNVHDASDKSVDDSDLLKTVTDLLACLPKQAIVLTQSGWFISQLGAVHLSKLNGGSQNESFLSVRLQQQERLAELDEKLTDIEAQIETLKKTIQQTQTKQEQCAIFVEELAAQLTAATHKRHDMQQQRTELVAKHDRQQSEQQRLTMQRAELDKEQQDINQELARLAEKSGEDAGSLDALVPVLENAKVKQQQLEQERLQMSQQERADNEALRQMQLQFSQAELAAKHSAEQIKQLNKEYDQLQYGQKRITEDLDRAQTTLPELEAQLKAASAAHHELKVALDERNAVIATLQAEVNEQQAKRNSLELELQQLQEKSAHCATQVAIADERINEASERLKALNTEVSPSALLTDYITHGRSISDSKFQKLHEEESRLTARLENMGPINLAAVAELAAVDERLLPLEQQINDITASMDTLTDAIASIDSKTKTLFLDTLESVNESLTGLFTKVFGGGQASLTLVKDEGLEKGEQWRAGLELMAQPKGKKNSRLAVLSGGEKTLTALSLIFAIFKQHPAPFCVLDEVDAPLDDANVARFTNLIADLADDVQFIFISHNKLAMQIADELKGITMPQAGISTLVSVSLEEAEKYLEPSA